MKAHICKNENSNVKVKTITGKSKRELLKCISPLLIPEKERTKEDWKLIDSIMKSNGVQIKDE